MSVKDLAFHHDYTVPQMHATEKDLTSELVDMLLMPCYISQFVSRCVRESAVQNRPDHQTQMPNHQDFVIYLCHHP